MEKSFKNIVDKVSENCCSNKSIRVKKFGSSINNYFRKIWKYIEKCGSFIMNDSKAVVISSVDSNINDLAKTKKWNIYPVEKGKKWNCYYLSYKHHWKKPYWDKQDDSHTASLKHTLKWEGLGLCFVDGITELDSLDWYAKMASVNHNLGLYSMASINNVEDSFDSKMMKNYKRANNKNKKFKWMDILHSQFAATNYSAKYIMTKHGIVYDTPEMRGRVLMYGFDKNKKLVAIIFPSLF